MPSGATAMYALGIKLTSLANQIKYAFPIE